MSMVPRVGDAIGLLRAQSEALVALPGTLLALNRSVRGLADAVAQAGDTVAAVQRLATRLDALVSELEKPVRDLAPGLQRLAAVLDDPVVDQVPDTLRKIS